MADAAREKHIEEQHKAGFKLRVSVFLVVFVAINHPQKNKQTTGQSAGKPGRQRRLQH